MAKFKDMDFIESGNWNVAEAYSKLKIMRHLSDIDEYIKVCNFGATELVNQLMLDEETENRAKITALKRLHKTIEMLIRNTLFAVKKDDVKKMETYLEYICGINNLLPKIQKTIKVQSAYGFSNKTTIETNIYNSILNVLVQISQELLVPLNKADLIFMSVDEFDPIKHKEEILRELSDTG